MTAQPSTLLEGTIRDMFGKKVRFLRREGLTPANLYGGGMTPLALQIPTRDLERHLHREGQSALVSLAVNGTTYHALLRDLQRHALTHAILHAEFYRVAMDQPIEVTVPVHLAGEAPASRLPNVIVTQTLFEMPVECLPGDIPHAIEVDIAGLTDADSSILVQDLTPPPGVTLLADPDLMVVHATESHVTAAEEAEAEEAAEVEATAERGERKATEEEARG